MLPFVPVRSPEVVALGGGCAQPRVKGVPLTGCNRSHREAVGGQGKAGAALPGGAGPGPCLPRGLSPRALPGRPGLGGQAAPGERGPRRGGAGLHRNRLRPLGAWLRPSRQPQPVSLSSF